MSQSFRDWPLTVVLQARVSLCNAAFIDLHSQTASGTSQKLALLTAQEATPWEAAVEKINNQLFFFFFFLHWTITTLCSKPKSLTADDSLKQIKFHIFLFSNPFVFFSLSKQEYLKILDKNFIFFIQLIFIWTSLRKKGTTIYKAVYKLQRKLPEHQEQTFNNSPWHDNHAQYPKQKAYETLLWVLIGWQVQSHWVHEIKYH